ncbi:hypothetical protein CHS0354_029040 [Potamilus streckersoni]|uniref:Uncharacterized protein n=1 Tax=Potamilus streckersoni TaxID=2493646 RepID=A0AAE0SFP4_9BIVA|nr:hypothetical protein CHS0354_029040 [Potamilus streckersoni]
MIDPPTRGSAKTFVLRLITFESHVNHHPYTPLVLRKKGPVESCSKATMNRIPKQEHICLLTVLYRKVDNEQNVNPKRLRPILTSFPELQNYHQYEKDSVHLSRCLTTTFRYYQQLRH